MTNPRRLTMLVRSLGDGTTTEALDVSQARGSSSMRSCGAPSLPATSSAV